MKDGWTVSLEAVEWDEQLVDKMVALTACLEAGQSAVYSVRRWVDSRVGK